MGIEPVSAFYKGGYHLVRNLPRPVSATGARLGASVLAEWSADRRLLVERNLKRVYGDDYGGWRLHRSVHRTFLSYARYWVDSFRLPGLDARQIDAGFAVSGFGNIARSLAGGIGPILVMPHLGGYEWAGFWLVKVLGLEVTVVVEPLEPQELFDFFADFRRALGINIVPLGPNAGPEVLRALKEGHVVALMADRDIAGDGIPVDFFGERTTLPAGPATLALRTGAPLLPTAAYFSRHGHHAVIGAPVPARRQGRFRADAARTTQELAWRLEGLIRGAPEQWHLQQPNWPSDYDALDAIGKPHPRPGRMQIQERVQV